MRAAALPACSATVFACVRGGGGAVDHPAPPLVLIVPRSDSFTNTVAAIAFFRNKKDRISRSPSRCAVASILPSATPRPALRPTRGTQRHCWTPPVDTVAVRPTPLDRYAPPPHGRRLCGAWTQNEIIQPRPGGRPLVGRRSAGWRGCELPGAGRALALIKLLWKWDLAPPPPITGRCS